MANANSLRYHSASGLTNSKEITHASMPMSRFPAWRLRPRIRHLPSPVTQHRSQPLTHPPHRHLVQMAAAGPPAGYSGGDSYKFDGSMDGDDDIGYGSGYVFDPDEEEAVSGRSPALAALAGNLQQVTDTNTLQTALAAAIVSQDFSLAAAVRDRLRELAAEVGGPMAAERIDWVTTGLPRWLTERAERLGYRFPTEVQRRSTPVLLSGADAVISSATGSGKSLAFLLPLLGRMSYPPDIFMEEMKGPQGLVLVPSMELGVQHALNAFRLFGGSINSGRPGDAANMFTYTGPKGIKVRGVLNKEEVVMAKSSLTYLRQVHLVVGTPAAVMEAVREPQPAAGLLRNLKMLVVDEVDECFMAFPHDMEELMRLAVAPGGTSREKTQVVLVGATQRQDVLQSAIEQGWLKEPVRIQVGREDTIPPALSHRYIVVPEARRLAALARCLRADLATADQDGAPARVMLFVDTPAQAAAVAEPLRSSLWADHRMAVLVPPGTILHRDAGSDTPPNASSSTPEASAFSWSQPQAPLPSSTAGTGGASINNNSREAGSRGAQDAATDASASSSSDSNSFLDDMFAYNPIRALHSFRDNTSSLLLATGAAARGLDLPAVTHVYSLGPPPDATQYLHRAGRAGRIGSTSGGIVTTLVSPEEVPTLLTIGQQLGIQLVQEQEPAGKALGALPRLQAASEDGDGGEDQGSEGAETQGQAQGDGGLREGQGTELGDVEQLRKGLEDLFHLM